MRDALFAENSPCRYVKNDIYSKYMSRHDKPLVMDTSKRQRLAQAGWKSGTAAEFLHLTAEEELYVELKASLCQQLRRQRQKSHLTQQELARRVKSSQSRIAKMEKGDPSVSIDLLIKSLLALGTTRREIARAIA